MQNLIDEYKKLAAEGGNFHGLSILKYKREIGKIVHQTGAKSLLDYGCGRGDAWHSPHNLHHYLEVKRKNLFLFDPAFEQHNKLPVDRTFDGVLCSDVLEHVPELALPATIQRLYEYSNKFVWASVCCRPAKKTFSDGTNLHVTVKPIEWWHSLFSTIGRATSIHLYGVEDSFLFYLTETE